MQLGRNNIQFKSLSIVLIYSLITPSFVRAGGDEPGSSVKSAILQLGSMQQASSVLKNLNAAMETAAQNPNDDWRREAVQKAYQAVPGAVQGVASTFGANAIGDMSLPFVLSTLGATIDTSAPLKFTLENPNPEAIQKSSEAPSQSDRPSEELFYVVKEEPKTFEVPVFKGGMSTPNTVASTGTTQQVSSVSTFAGVADVVAISETNSTPVSKPVFQESKNTAPTWELSSKVSTPVPDVISKLNEDIAVAEGALKQAEELKTRELSSQAEPGFLSETVSKKDSKNDQPKQKSKPAPVQKPTSWLLAPLFYLTSFEQEAHAGGANPSGQSGQGGSGVLFGLAALIAAASPMVVAGIESSKEQNIATIQADAQIQQAEIQTSTQKQMARLSSQTALAQAQVQQDVAKMNNDAQTQRLQINLAAQQQIRNEQRQSEMEQMALQRQLDAQKTALAMQQADAQIMMVRQNNEAQKLQNALSGNSGSSAAANSAQRNGSSYGSSGGGSPIAAALAAQAAQAGQAGQAGENPASMGQQSSSPGTWGGGGARATAPTSTSYRGVGSRTSRLLASAGVGVASAVENIPAIKNAVNRTNGIMKSVRGARAISRAPLTNARGIYRSGLSQAAAGSFYEGRTTSQRDLTRFALQADSGSSEAAGFEIRRPIRQNAGQASH